MESDPQSYQHAFGQSGSRLPAFLRFREADGPEGLQPALYDSIDPHGHGTDKGDNLLLLCGRRLKNGFLDNRLIVHNLLAIFARSGVINRFDAHSFTAFAYSLKIVWFA